ncbi:Histone-lysine N-trimethyltransferase SMYD5 [Acropora cervicornis]|uniref:Histone-lysine N-trimethyltransferase SMYD5 n=1 Tax=Acropora cervicornis TaxID=6130 RepID=A0AAD9R3F5_ACRCE|nr:Histone-lysine N-trimethyltransferase SMYD5 [Acropora cervicornis]
MAVAFPENANFDRRFSVRLISAEKGRGLFSEKNFEEGEIIFEERPVVCSQFLWNAMYDYLACGSCMKSLESAEQMARRLTGNAALELPHASRCCEITRFGQKVIKCHRCQVRYCSEECRQYAWDQYHRTLCLGENHGDPNHPLELLQEAWRKMHYPPETASVMLIAQMIATVLQALEPGKQQGIFEAFCHSVVNKQKQIVHKLLGDQFKEQLDLLQVLMSNALFDEKLQQWFEPEGFKSLVALIGTNGQGIGTSSLSIYFHNLENLADVSQDERQALDLFIDQLYEEMDRGNHSCEPNAEVTFPYNNSTLALKALCSIQPEEEIVICYLGECDRERSRHSRQRLLRENYLFSCACAKCECQAGEPEVISSEDEEESMDGEDYG